MLRQASLFAVFACTFCARLQAADPAGTWRWESEELREQGVAQNTLVLKNDRGTLTGVCSGTKGEISVSAITLDADELTWSLDVEVRGQPLLARFSGKLTGDELLGQVALGSLGKYSWRAQRDVNPAGVWRWESKDALVTNAVQHVLAVTVDNGKLIGSYSGDNGNVPVETVTVQGNELSWNMNADVQGQKTAAVFSGKITGDNVVGMMTVNGQQKSPWRARRERQWRFHVKIPDGSVYSPLLHFAETDDGMVGRFSNDDGAVLPVQDLAVSRDGDFFFKFTVLGIKTRFRGQFGDEKGEGVVEYDNFGDTGESTFTAERVQ